MLGGASYTVYIGLLALAANIVVAALVTLVTPARQAVVSAR